ncbi:MAG TPA: efflux RND transporter periplasmic adaptor subunit [Bryobacteraceae bacterium]|nr:efflux RND transporter periplasmic adaptor subunit [Bryobacteraceae bacterium]HOQ44992.1 efflux RND transporter periplasmic adaptor subunit [Bryobacteraceae bacterium]HPU73696.1 efflux RND transporter periplasmic adaptor subunit [Bryobacteraceae bacterium]
MKSRTPVLIAVLIAAVGIAYYAGRKSVQPPAAREAGDAHSTEHAEHAGELTLTPEAQRRFDVQFATAEVRPLGQAIQATGSVQANGSRVAHIRAIARGRIDSVYVRLGDRVRAGQRLLVYDNAELGEAIGQYLSALADLQKATAETEVSKRALERAQSLVDLGAIARAEYQRREAEHKYALATVESRRAEAAKIEEKLHRFGMTDAEIGKLDPRAGLEYHREQSHSTLTAPFSGVITQFSAAPGETIGPETELMTIADLSTVWVLADLYEKDIHAVREGQRAEVFVPSYPGRVFAGVISYVSDVLDANTRTAKVRVEVPNPEDLLKLEMFATVRIPAPASRSAVAIPAAAVQNVDGATVAFVKTAADRFEKRTLKLGQRSGDWVEIIDGIKAGEVVVTEGSFLLKSEARKGDLGHHHEE